MRFLTRLTVLGLAGYGATALYQRFQPRLADIAARRDTLLLAADRVGEEAKEAVHDVADEARRAARDVRNTAPERPAPGGPTPASFEAAHRAG